MKKLLIIALLLASCTESIDIPNEAARYDVLITAEYEIYTVSMQSGIRLGRSEYAFETLYDKKNVSQKEKNKAVQTYPEGFVTMHEPLDNGLLRVTDGKITHQITKR